MSIIYSAPRATIFYRVQSSFLYSQVTVYFLFEYYVTLSLLTVHSISCQIRSFYIFLFVTLMWPWPHDLWPFNCKSSVIGTLSVCNILTKSADNMVTCLLVMAHFLGECMWPCDLDLWPHNWSLSHIWHIQSLAQFWFSASFHSWETGLWWTETDRCAGCGLP